MKQITVIDNEIIENSSGIFRDKYGDVYYLLNGDLHREDGPAVESSIGNIWWYLYGIKANSEKEFYDPEWRKKLEIKRFL